MKNEDYPYDKEYELSLKNQFKEFRNELNSYKETTEKFMDSSNYLLKTVYLDHETNKPNTLLDYLQSMSIEVLDFVKNVCDKHEINDWWIDFGNLLGAVRHGSFVPWDDDMDIGMMREDYLRFDEVVYDEIKLQGLTDIVEVGYRPFRPGIPKFIQVYVRQHVQIAKYKFVLGNVDIFPYEYIKSYNEETLYEDYREAKNKYLHHRSKDFNLKYAFDTYYEDLNLSWEPTDHIIPGWESPCTPDDMYSLIVLEADKIFPIGEIEFAGKTYPDPHDPDEDRSAARSKTGQDPHVDGKNVPFRKPLPLSVYGSSAHPPGK